MVFIVIIRLMLLVSFCTWVITLSGFHCSIELFNQNYFILLEWFKFSILETFFGSKVISKVDGFI